MQKMRPLFKETHIDSKQSMKTGFLSSGNPWPPDCIKLKPANLTKMKAPANSRSFLLLFI